MNWQFDDAREHYRDDAAWIVIVVRVPGQEFQAWLALVDCDGISSHHVRGPSVHQSLTREEWWPPHWNWIPAP